MKRILLIAMTGIMIVFSTGIASAQNIGINADGSTPDANAILDIKAANKGLLIPRTSTATRITIPNTKGLLLYDTNTSTFWFNDGNSWQQISNGSSALNGTVNYVAKFTGTSTAGNSQIFDDGKNVGIGTTTPLARLQVTDSSVLFSAAGDIPAVAHNTPISKNGRRMMWYPDKAAFRVGYTVFDEWDSVNIGKYFIGMGYGNRATGLYSVSLGNGSGASGRSSVGVGELNDAIGDYSFAAGQFTTAKGMYSTATGYTTRSTGIAAIAMGYRSEADGDYSVALGNETFASQQADVALGNETGATGFACTAMGNHCNASSNYSTALGDMNNATGQSSLATGDNTNATGFACTTMGLSTTASNFYSVAMGSNTTASGSGSVAMGFLTTAAGQYSFVWGTNSNATGNSSLVLGSNLFDGGHKGDAMLGDTDPWNAGAVGSGTDDQMICRFNNGYYFLTGGNTNRTGVVASHGDNSWSVISDSTKKEKIIPVDGEALLKKISQFKLGTWNYKGQDPTVYRHYGPMAQDFHQAFGRDALGTIGNDTLINQSDFLGVSFTAIQALEKRTEKIEQQQQQIESLKNQNEILATDNEQLRSQLQLLISTVSDLDKKVQSLALIQNHSNVAAVK